MPIRAKLLQALDQLSESELVKTLEFVSSLKSDSCRQPKSSDPEQSNFWQAYLASVEEREEVYRRLANS